MEGIKDKANYCLSCKTKPCTKGCPLENDITEFIKKIKEENFEEAYKILCNTTVLESVCGRICPHERQCQGSCVRSIKSEPVTIGDLEAYIGDMAIEKGYKIEKSNCKKNKKVAVVGSGPSGLTCSAFLAKNGYDVTIFEKHDKLGGLLVHGIPDFRLPKDIVQNNIDKILDLGVKYELNMELSKNLELEELRKNYDAVFLGFGANKSSKMGIEGEDLEGVYGGNKLLEYGNHPDYNGKIVSVIGGGNVAMDSARTIKRLGAREVKIIYRRAEEQMPADAKEIKSAKDEGIEFCFLNNIIKIIGQDKVQKLECIKTELVKKEGESRAVPVNIEGSNYTINMDIVVMALGSKADDFVKDLGLTLNKWNGIEIDENNMTSMEGVFAGGDIAGEKSTVAWAARSGRNAAYAIMKYLENEK